MTEDDTGSFVAMCVDREDYGWDVRIADAPGRLRMRRPAAVTFAQRVGYRTPFCFVPRKADDV